MNSFPFAMALLMGLTGSLHCAGMCGPVIWIMPFQSFDAPRRWLAMALYHVARISVYALFGLVLYSFTSFFRPEWQQYVSLTLGALLLIAGIATFFPLQKLSIHLPWTAFVRKRMGQALAAPGLTALFFAGMLNGLLPCGLVYMALSMAVTASSPLQAMLLMYVFGAGTVPALVTLSVLKSRLRFLQLAGIRRLVPVSMLVFGGLFILRGMNLGIPYLSPAVKVQEQTVQASCCHKP
jgi:sulfite exporter TauE/SafE